MNTEKICVSIPVEEYRELILAKHDAELMKTILKDRREEAYGLSRDELDSICKLFCDNQQDESW